MEFKTVPYEHQRTGFDRLKDYDCFALQMDMGTGKTKLAIDVAAHKYLTEQCRVCLVIAPNGIHSEWKKQIELHCAVPFGVFIWDSQRIQSNVFKRALNNFLFKASDRSRLPFLLVNVEAFQSDTVIPYIADYVKRNAPFIVIDESTRIKEPSAKRSKTIHRLNKYGHRCTLTGTPAIKSPFDLWSQFEFLRKNYFNRNYYMFKARYGVTVRMTNPHTGGKFSTLIDLKTWNIVKSRLKKRYEMRGEYAAIDFEEIAAMSGVSESNVRFIASQEAFQRYKNLEELRDLIAPITYTVRKEDCLDLPPKVYERIPVRMNKEQAKVYKDLKRELLAQYAGQELSVTNKVALTTRLMQIAGGFFPYRDEDETARHQQIGKKNVKLDALTADLEELDDNRQVIIWATFVAELKAIAQRLSREYGEDNVALYYGATSNLKRRFIVEAFQAGKLRFFVGNPATAGFGLNLQAATMQYFYSNSFRTEERLQAEDRSHRIGVQGTCVYKDIVASDTVDESVVTVNAEGKKLNDFFRDTPVEQLW